MRFVVVVVERAFFEKSFLSDSLFFGRRVGGRPPARPLHQRVPSDELYMSQCLHEISRRELIEHNSTYKTHFGLL